MTQRERVAARLFDAQDQTRFATLTGDRNPMHVDALYARRTQAGAPVVHGMHALLWSLEELAMAGLLDEPISRCTARFNHFVYVGDEATLRVVRCSETRLRAEIVSAGITAATLDIAFGDSAPARPSRNGTPIPSLVEPLERDLAAVAACAGWITTEGDGTAKAFPHICARIGARRVAAIAKLSYLVGMVCPGLHSIFSECALSFIDETRNRDTADGTRRSGISFRVENVDERVRLANIAVGGNGIAGTLMAFLRQPPVAQRTLAEISRLVRPFEFAGSTALVVGGSRGLGAATARILAAGGARVAITYAVGVADARELASEIGFEGCAVMQYDARDEAGPQLEALPWPIDQLYYFATKQIYRPKTGLFAADRFAEFCAVYVSGFERICAALRPGREDALRAFYPSSIFVEDRPRDMTEYAMAKAAGEILCADMNRFDSTVNVLVRRLPRVLTDQTATVMPVDGFDALDIMLPIVREMHVARTPPAS
jgi:acyl dehydratase